MVSIYKRSNSVYRSPERKSIKDKDKSNQKLDYQNDMWFSTNIKLKRGEPNPFETNDSNILDY
jgi:hypothetical protein